MNPEQTLGEKEAVDVNTPKGQNELLPCPFCGMKVRRGRHDEVHHDYAETRTAVCALSGRSFSLHDWNKRAP